jgi:hypothetical protein
MSRRTVQLAYQAIHIEGGLIPADELARLTSLQTPDATEQSESHYAIPKGLKLRDEIGRFWKIAMNQWVDFQPLRGRADLSAHDVSVREFLLPLLRDVLGFADLTHGASVEASGHTYQLGYAAAAGRVPLILSAHDLGLDTPADRFGEFNPETGKVRRRSPFMLAQEALNASDAALWAVVSNGLKLRILRDNPSLTRPSLSGSSPTPAVFLLLPSMQKAWHFPRLTPPIAPGSDGATLASKLACVPVTACATVSPRP